MQGPEAGPTVTLRDPKEGQGGGGGEPRLPRERSRGKSGGAALQGLDWGALERRAVISVRKPFLWLLRGVLLQGERGSLETHPLGWLWRQGRGW